MKDKSIKDKNRGRIGKNAEGKCRTCMVKPGDSLKPCPFTGRVSPEEKYKCNCCKGCRRDCLLDGIEATG